MSKNYGAIPAKAIPVYMEYYKEYLSDNNLADDSKSISIESLIDFVDEIILLSELDEDKRPIPLVVPELEPQPAKVLIVVRSGIADFEASSGEVDVHIVDHDSNSHYTPSAEAFTDEEFEKLLAEETEGFEETETEDVDA